MEICEGIVVEGNRDNYTMQPHILLPEMSSNEITDSLIEENYYPNMPISQGMIINDESGSVTSLLTTTDQSFSKTAGYELTTYEKEDGDIDGSIYRCSDC